MKEQVLKFLNEKSGVLVSQIISVTSKDYDDEEGIAYEQFIVECLVDSKIKTCLIDSSEFNRWREKTEIIKWVS